MAKNGRNVVGSTSTNGPALSDEQVKYRTAQNRTVRYQYQKAQSGWWAWVCGPFHSKCYGTSSLGRTKHRAKEALSDNLARNYGYIGKLLFSDVDEADTVGNVNRRLLDERARALPITIYEACVVAGI